MCPFPPFLCSSARPPGRISSSSWSASVGPGSGGAPRLDLWPLLEAADRELAAGPRPTPAILRVTVPHDPEPAAPELAWFPLERAHPLDALLGFSAPPEWVAAGIVSGGRARRLDERASSRTAATISVMVDRSGAAATLLRRGDRIDRLADRPEGSVADALRRALGLPTAAPPASSAPLWAAWWLDRIVEAAAASSGRERLSSWAEVVALHPAVPLVSAGSRLGPGPDAVVVATQALADAWPWYRLRREPGAVELPGTPVSAEVADWMDDGMFARWLLGEFPAIDDLLEAVDGLLPAVIAERVAEVTRAAVRTGG